MPASILTASGKDFQDRDLVARARQSASECDQAIGPLEKYRAALQAKPQAQFQTELMESLRVKNPEAETLTEEEAERARRSWRCTECDQVHETPRCCETAAPLIPAGVRFFAEHPHLLMQFKQINQDGDDSARAKPVSALDRAKAALAEHPEKSNRALAAEIGINYQTVRRARQEMQAVKGDVSVDVPVDVRVGRDGRRRKAPTSSDYRNGNDGGLIDELFPKGSPACDIEWEANQPGADAEQHRRAFKWQKLEAERLAVECALLRDGVDGRHIHKTDIESARKVARHWANLAQKLQQMRRP